MHRRTCARTAPRRVVEQCCYLSLPWTNHVSSPTPHQRATLPSQRIMNAAHTSATTSHPSLAHCSSPMLMARRYQHNNNNNNNIHALDEVPMEALMDDTADLHTELESAVVDEATHTTTTTTTAMQDVGAEAHTTTSSTVVLERINAPPGRFDLLTNSLCYTWKTTAQHARKVSGPMREWSSELKYRTGVHIEVEPTYPQRLSNNVRGGDAYATADEVDMTVYLFGSERGIFNCRRLMESAIEHDACYVRVGVFRRVAHGDGVEWLTLRRINHDLRPPDIPPISLKHPGKWCLMYENVMEAAVRSVWEETGITLNPAHMYPSARLVQHDPTYYWRVPVMYFVAEVAPTVEVLGPQVMQTSYMQNWDVRLLRQSPDAMDRAWAQHADPTTGCAWMRGSMIDALQMPLRGANYMATRYTPPPHAELNEVVGLHAEQQHSSSTSLEDGVGDASATQVPKE